MANSLRSFEQSIINNAKARNTPRTGAGDKENITGRPSAGWLNRPGWIDGGRNPPRFYRSEEEIQHDLEKFGTQEQVFEHRARMVFAQTDPDFNLIVPPRAQPPEIHPDMYTQLLNYPVPFPGNPAPLDNGATQFEDHAAAFQGHAVQFHGDTPLSQHHYPRVRQDVVPPAEVPLSLSDDAGNDATVPVSVALITVESEARTTTGRGSAKSAPPKKVTVTKMDHLSIIPSLTQADFISATLAVHDLSDDFRAGEHSGPQFKMWWTGLNKANAQSIDTDRDFNTAVKAVLQKSHKTCRVNVEYDMDRMVGFRVLQQIGREETQNDENLTGTQVPRVDQFDETAQLHGQFVMQLKKQWPCNQHLGENGGMGYCYVTPDKEHVVLNNRKLALWAAAIAAAECTKREPPSILDFDGHAAAKPRGHTGPRSVDLLNALYMTKTPKRHRRRSPSSSPPRRSTRRRKHSPSSSPPRHSTRRRTREHSPTPSPLPAVGSELRACLTAFARDKGIDFTSFEDTLRALDFTPDIIPEVSTDLLRDIVGGVEGQILKPKLFAREWNAKLETKRRH
ncbi:hypothetical protein BD410DRAFT_832118 [Rickenella mellea]|uniref:Uncharacterized protein n=1 Tax=Rickenella mellea TaxID=50990 RepID=A0A4Y7PNB9_9AGAM|nr:hypothetical protein BD410DRAFT_832118 [Rickenella mellea]